jgi:hypothetical protein
LFEFEKIFEVDLNIGFKVQLSKNGISKQSPFSLAAQASSRPVSFLSCSFFDLAHQRSWPFWHISPDVGEPMVPLLKLFRH